ncbi:MULTISPECIES: hypothetical protein [unclassified Streptomyces]|uniref:hypothetical protein n=1 Tax=Streptomyces sp. NPDC127532 TaxID=3345399 RepID=UPI003639EBF0
MSARTAPHRTRPAPARTGPRRTAPAPLPNRTAPAPLPPAPHRARGVGAGERPLRAMAA